MSEFVLVNRELLERVCIPVCRESYPAIDELRAVLAQEAGTDEVVGHLCVTYGHEDDPYYIHGSSRVKSGPETQVIPLYASPPATAAVVLPDRISPIAGLETINIFTTFETARGWNACLDKVKELNQ